MQFSGVCDEKQLIAGAPVAEMNVGLASDHSLDFPDHFQDADGVERTTSKIEGFTRHGPDVQKRRTIGRDRVLDMKDVADLPAVALD